MNAPEAKEPLLERLLTVDTRVLGLFRIAFGTLLLTNLYDRASALGLISFYSNEGVWPNHYALFLPPVGHYWSLLLPFSSPEAVTAAFVAIGIVYTLYLVGWRTRLMQVLALICLESLNFRFFLVQHGGAVVTNLVAVWTVFLPLGHRYSLDALFRSLRHGGDDTVDALAKRPWEALRTTVVKNPAFLVICVQFACIYFFNTVHKTGPTWRDGSAVHHLAWVNRLATHLAIWLRTHGLATLSPLLSWGTLVVEGALPVLILSPWRQRWLRPIAFALILGLHGSIAALAHLGPFSYVMMCFGTLLLQPWLLDALEARAGRGAPVDVKVDWADPVQRFWARVAARLDVGRRLRFSAVPAHQVTQAQLAEVAGALPFGPALKWVPQLPYSHALGRWLGTVGSQALPSAPVPPAVPAFERLGAGVRAVALALVVAAAGSQLLMENAAVPQAMKPQSRPDWMTALVDALDLMQGWHEFAPETPSGDYRLVVDATLADGSHVDPLTDAPPDFEPWREPFWDMNQHWCEFHGRFVWRKEQWRYTRDWLRRLPRIKGWGRSKEIVALEVWKVSYDAPPLGGTEPVNTRKERLFGDEPL